MFSEKNYPLPVSPLKDISGNTGNIYKNGLPVSPLKDISGNTGNIYKNGYFTPYIKEVSQIIIVRILKREEMNGEINSQTNASLLQIFEAR
jgi:hypothetical protein